MNRITVTPFVGVWIETFRVAHSEKWVESHPSWVCGLKLLRRDLLRLPSGHTLRGCVD